MGTLSTIGDALDRVAQAGGSLWLSGEKIKLCLPEDCGDSAKIVEALRRDRQAVIAMLRDIESKPPSLEEVKAMLPPGVQVLKYQPRTPPFAVAPVSVVTNAGRFFRAYLRDMAWRLEHPKAYACAPLHEILAKLAEAGVELEIDASRQREQETLDLGQN